MAPLSSEVACLQPSLGQSLLLPAPLLGADTTMPVKSTSEILLGSVSAQAGAAIHGREEWPPSAWFGKALRSSVTDVLSQLAQLADAN